MVWISRWSLLLLLVLPGCYHMRLFPEPVPTEAFPLNGELRPVRTGIVRILEADGFILDGPASSERQLCFESRQFTTETGYGHPVEGRRYYGRLRVILRPEGQKLWVDLTQDGLLIRSHYVENFQGAITELEKTYPYEVYPGMFDMGLVRKELQRIRRFLERNSTGR